MAFGDFAMKGNGVLLPTKEYIITQDVARNYDESTTEIYHISKHLVDADSPMYIEKLTCSFRDKVRLRYSEMPYYTKEMITSADMFGRCIFIIDGTGVGQAVFDLYNAAGLDPFYISITGGSSTSAVKGRSKNGFSSSQFGDLCGANVPKQDLYASLRSHLERGLILNGTSRYADISKKQFEHFQVEIKKNKSVTYENDKPSTHDDFVTTAMLACWAHDNTWKRAFGKTTDNMPNKNRNYRKGFKFDNSHYSFKGDKRTWGF